MTKRQLSQLYWLKKEIARYEQRLAELQQMRDHIGSSCAGSGHSGGRESRTERLGMEIADLEAIIEAKKIQRIHEAAVIERYIAEIPDAYTRLIFRLRYIDCMSWVKIAMTLRGTTAEAARKAATRYIDKFDEPD